jgi:hypothetical protein
MTTLALTRRLEREARQCWRVRPCKGGVHKIQRFLPLIGYSYPCRWVDLDGWGNGLLRFRSNAEAKAWAMEHLD